MLMNFLRSIKYWFSTKKMMKPYFEFVKNNLASNYAPVNREKLRSYILMQSHVIEKGLSLSDVKPWFGQQKIKELMDDTKLYYSEFHDKMILYWVVSMLQSYMDYNSTNDGKPIKIVEQFEELKSLLGDFCDETLKGGFVSVNKKDIQHQSNFDYAQFTASRHSVRSFTGEPVDMQSINNALKIAETTPSACNRQPWYNYVVTDKNIIEEILTIQHGARQFKDQVSALIITASSAHFFFGYEFNQMYFNTGLYSMNLLLALHAEGLGTIPLNLGLSNDKLTFIKEICGMPDSQMPISLIAIGVLPESYKYAKSARFSYKDYTKFI